MMRKISLFFAVAACLTLFSVDAFADNPHVIANDSFCTVETNGDLHCEGSVGGLGNVDRVSITVVAHRTCENNGGNFPEGQNRDETDRNIRVKNGRADFNVTLKGCPGKMTTTWNGDGEADVFVDGFGAGSIEIDD